MRKSKLLFPYHYKWIGLVLTVAGAIGIFMYLSFKIQWSFLEFPVKTDDIILGDSINFTDEVFYVSLILGLLFVSFSKERYEDERVERIRLESLHWTIYFHYSLLILSILLVHGLAFLDVLIFNLFLPLLFFVLRFRWVILMESKRLSAEN